MEIGPNVQIIIISAIVILSFLFNSFSERTNIPAVLLLIFAGIGLKFGADQLGLSVPDLNGILSVMGTIGLIMIVLEAALELELTRDKLPTIWKSLLGAFVGLLASTFVAAAIIHYFVEGIDWMTAMLYATPLSILSSAIIIPSVGSLVQDKKEFHIYESTFSDILGIMVFYFIEALIHAQHDPQSGNGDAIFNFGASFLITIGISLLASYLLIFLFQNIKSHVKLFLLIFILTLLYGIGKTYHLSPLIMILVFGLFMSNSHLFFRGRLSKWLDKETIHKVEGDFHTVTVETAFVVRTFFFVIFGITISLASLLSMEVLKIGGTILLSIYVVRWIIFRLMGIKDTFPQLFIAPRGLITVLLFISIPEDIAIDNFNDGILLFVIMATSIIMPIALIVNGRNSAKIPLSEQEDPLVIPADRIYKGFQSKLVEEKYSQDN